MCQSAGYHVVNSCKRKHRSKQQTIDKSVNQWYVITVKSRLTFSNLYLLASSKFIRLCEKSNECLNKQRLDKQQFLFLAAIM